MESNKILQADYLDLIFDNRNKNYGSYELRKHYQRRAAKALGIMLASLVLAVAIPYLIGLGSHGNDAVLHAAAVDVPVEMIHVTYPEKKILPPPAPETKTHNESIAKTFKSTEPVIAKTNDIKPDPPKMDDLDRIPGAADNEGNGGIHSATTATPPSGPPGGSNNIPSKMEDPGTKEVVANYTDVSPEYPGGMAALLEYLQRNIRYPNEARENQIQGKVVVRFVVNKEGKIEGAEIQKGIGYGCDKEALRVVNAMKTWKPGQVKGKAVKAYYTLPITFRLDS